MILATILGALRRNAPARPATVVCFDCRGCMATDHRLDWIGEVVGYEYSEHEGRVMRIRVLKRGNDGRDFRDGDLGEETEVVANHSLQEVRPGLFFIYK